LTYPAEFYVDVDQFAGPRADSAAPTPSPVGSGETAITAVGFLRRGKAFFESYGMTIDAVMTDSAAPTACRRQMGRGRLTRQSTCESMFNKVAWMAALATAVMSLLGIMSATASAS
jgi:hypothetical protein